MDLIRDEFAIKILQAMLSNSWMQKEFNKDLKDYTREQRAEYLKDFHIKTAYEWADAMLEIKIKTDAIRKQNEYIQKLSDEKH